MQSASIWKKEEPKHTKEVCKKSLCQFLQDELDSRNWTQADLSRASGISKSTITRYLNQDQRAKKYRIKIETIFALGLALSLSEEKMMELIHIAFPEFSVWKMALDEGYSVQELEEALYDENLPPLLK